MVEEALYIQFQHLFLADMRSRIFLHARAVSVGAGKTGNRVIRQNMDNDRPLYTFQNKIGHGEFAHRFVPFRDRYAAIMLVEIVAQRIQRFDGKAEIFPQCFQFSVNDHKLPSRFFRTTQCVWRDAQAQGCKATLCATASSLSAERSKPGSAKVF